MRFLPHALTMSAAGLVVLLSACTSASPEESSTGEAPLVGDISSMMQRPDGLFDVICKDGSREVASTADLLANRVCSSGSGSSSSSGSSGGGFVPVPFRPGDTVIFRGADCKPADALLVIDPQYHCNSIDEGVRALSLLDRTGFCKNVSGIESTAHQLCWNYRGGYARSPITLYSEEFCWNGSAIGTVEPHESCDKLPDRSPPGVNSLVSRWGCRSFLNGSPRSACRSFRFEEGNTGTL